MNSAGKPHRNANISVSSVLRRSPVFRISKLFLSKFITASRESEVDHWPIMEILATYVRQRAPRRLEEDGGPAEESTTPTYDELPAPDIQAILTILRRRTRHYGHGEPEPLDL